jgi:hypothetical protein
MAGVTGVLPAGQHAFGVDCREFTATGNGIEYFASVTAIALSDG